MNLKHLIPAAVCGSLLLSAAARAENFTLNVTGNSTSVSAGGSSVPDLVDDLLNRQGEFQQFNGQAFASSLKYGGVNNAILLDSNSAGTDVTLSIPSTGFSRTFTGSSRSDVQDQIEDFLLKDGSAEYAKFLEQINRQSLLGVVDGNPRATTALFSDHAFRTFGLYRSPQQIDPWVRGGAASNFRFDFDAGKADNDEADETFFNGALGTGIVGQNVALTITTIGQYRDVNDSILWSVGTELALPIQFIPYEGRDGLTWTLTPHGFVGAGASYDLAAGGTMWGAGVTSSIGIYAGDLIFTIANQITFFEGFGASFGDYEFDTKVSQQVVKNGVGVGYIIGRAIVDASITHTLFLQDAAVEEFWTPSAGIGFRFGEASGLRLAYKGDFADNYTAHGGELTFYFGF